MNTRPHGFRQRFHEQHRPGNTVEFAVPTSVMMTIEDILAGDYRGDVMIEITAQTARNLQTFSAAGQPELLIPIDAQSMVVERRKDYVMVREVEPDYPVPANNILSRQTRSSRCHHD